MTRQGPRAVVAREYNDEYAPLRSAWVIKLADQRDISRVITKIGKLFPSLSHLKRCSAKRLVLGFAPSPDRNPDFVEIDQGYLTRDEIEALLDQADVDRSILESDELTIVEVPAVAPRTKAQAKRASKIWPLNFHPDPMIERTLDGSCFDNDQLETIDRCSRLCIDVAKIGKARGTRECNGSAVIFDPLIGKIVAIAASRIDLHPMWHASVLAVDLVARLEPGGGAYDLPLTINDKPRKSGEKKYPRLENYNVDRFPLAYPNELVDLARTFEHTEKRPKHTTYLCTDHWVFLLCEPCPLCAMALLHSRVSNIFYGIANESRGVLGTKALLHEVPGLNHRYRVWKGAREDECRSTFAQIQTASE